MRRIQTLMACFAVALGVVALATAPAISFAAQQQASTSGVRCRGAVEVPPISPGTCELGNPPQKGYCLSYGCTGVKQSTYNNADCSIIDPAGTCTNSDIVSGGTVTTYTYSFSCRQSDAQTSCSCFAYVSNPMTTQVSKCK